jgi:hypothetical protein
MMTRLQRKRLAWAAGVVASVALLAAMGAGQVGPPRAPTVSVVDVDHIPLIYPALQTTPGQGVPRELRDRGVTFLQLPAPEMHQFPLFELIYRQPRDVYGHGGGPGVLVVQTRLDDDDAKRLGRPPHIWNWHVPEKQQSWWHASSEALGGFFRGRERFLALLVYDPKWEDVPSVALLDSMAQPQPNADTLPRWQADLPVAPFYAAAPESNTPRFPLTPRPEGEPPGRRAAVSVAPDGRRVLVGLAPEPDASKCGFWLFDGEGNLLRIIIFPGRYTPLMGPAVVRSQHGSYWRVLVHRPAERAEAGEPWFQDAERGNTGMVTECYLLDKDGSVVGRTVDGGGRNAPVREGPDFSTDDRWAYALYEPTGPGNSLGTIVCYYDLGAPRASDAPQSPADPGGQQRSQLRPRHGR